MLAAHNDSARMVSTDADVIDAVASTPGAIGFVEEHSITQRVNVIRVDGKLPWNLATCRISRDPSSLSPHRYKDLPGPPYTNLPPGNARVSVPAHLLHAQLIVQKMVETAPSQHARRVDTNAISVAIRADQAHLKIGAVAFLTWSRFSVASSLLDDEKRSEEARLQFRASDAIMPACALVLWCLSSSPRRCCSQSSGNGALQRLPRIRVTRPDVRSH